MKNNYCRNCGGPIKTYNARCEYCGTVIVSNRELSPIDHKRIKVTAQILDTNLWNLAYDKMFKYSFIFSIINLFLLCGVTIFHYKLTQSILIPSIILPLAVGIILRSYFEEIWYSFNRTSKTKIYEKEIVPIKNQFLKNYNYFGFEWEKIIFELEEQDEIQYLHEMIRPPTTYQKEKEKINLVVRYFDDLAYNNKYTIHNFRVPVFILTVMHVALFSVIIHPLLNKNIYIPLAWIIPILLWLYAELFDKMDFIWDIIPYKPSNNFIKKKLIPLIKEYCFYTKTTKEQLIQQANLLELYSFRILLEKHLK